MAWTYEQTFDALNDGTLGGQNSYDDNNFVGSFK